MAWKEISPEKMEFNPFTLINNDWMLISAGNSEKHNAMTASWGGVGELWGKYVSTIYVRPQRYTLEFIEKEDYYALCFFDETYRSALKYYGSHSGRDGSKEQATGLTPLFDQAAPYYAEARLVLICRKLYRQDMKAECFLDPADLEKWYPSMDLHRVFIGEIVKVLEKA
jgi:flavin reductase (DIM6/NTAB) family NADH-FMN oxidoreductase RutF